MNDAIPVASVEKLCIIYVYVCREFLPENNDATLAWVYMPRKGVQYDWKAEHFAFMQAVCAVTPKLPAKKK